MRLLKRIVLALLALLLVIILGVIGIVVALNSQAGRNFAVREINKYGKSVVHIAGLGGHFPADIKLASLELKDKNGVWLNGQGATLKWSPLALLHRTLSVQELTAARIDIARAPLPFAKPDKKKKGLHLPNIQMNLDRLNIRTLSIAPGLAGEYVALHVTGSAHIRNMRHGKIALRATTSSGNANYVLAATLNPRNVSMTLHVNEPAGGLIGHFAVPQVRAPLTIDMALNGPSDRAKLQAHAALGDARLNIEGAVGLDPSDPFADVMLSIPALAPFGNLARQSVNGDSQLHLVVAQTTGKAGATLSLHGHMLLNQAPAGLNKLLAGRTNLSLLASLQSNSITISHLALAAPQFSLRARGTIGATKLNLTAEAKLDSIATLSPQLRGDIQAHGRATGNLRNFNVDADISGQANVPHTSSGTFNIAVHATHLPKAAYGTLTGTGMLAGSPLTLHARFARDADGAASIKVTHASWKSVAAWADLNLAAGTRLPTGTAHVTLGKLSNFNIFTGGHMSGAVRADFAYQQDQSLKLGVTLQNALAVPAFGAVNGEIHAEGQLAALAVHADATVARLDAYPAKLNLTGVLDAPAQSAHLTDLNADWHGLTLRLKAPADISTKPSIAVHHVNIALGRANVTLDGTLSPDINAKASVRNLDLSMLKKISSKLHATGIVNLDADITGTPKTPAGRITLDGTGLRYKPTAGLPAASVSGTAVLKGTSVDVNLTASAGPDARIRAHGAVPLAMTGPVRMNADAQLNLAVLNPLLAKKMHATATGMLVASLQLAGTPQAPTGQVVLNGTGLRSTTGPAAALPSATIAAKARLNGRTVGLNAALNAGHDVHFTISGTTPVNMTEPMNLNVAGKFDLKLLDPLLMADGNLVRGIITTKLHVTGTPRTPLANGALRLSGGAVQNIASGLNMTAISANIAANTKLITLQSFRASAGKGTISGKGTANLGDPAFPVNIALNAQDATPIASDLVTETLNAALRIQGDLKKQVTLGGQIDILKANINIPRSLPPSVADLQIHDAGKLTTPRQSAAPPMPPLKLALQVNARNQIFIRGDGLFAELGGHIGVNGTTKNPQPTGTFNLIRGSFSLAGRTLKFTSGNIDFNGGGLNPALDLEATATTSDNGTATLAVGGTAAKPQINLSSSPPLPSDEVLSQLLFAQSTTGLSPFQAASLAAALAQISGIGGGINPLDSVRNALGLDQLSLGSSTSGSPSVQAGRYLAPGVYVGASQAASGQGTSANVEINLYKGLKLQTSTGTDSTGQSSSVGLSYQFNY